MFIRVKKVKNKNIVYEYAHLVKGIWKKRKINKKLDKKVIREYNNSVHKYKKILGRVYRFEQKCNIELNDHTKNFQELIKEKNIKEIYKTLIEYELIKRGF